MLGPKEGLVRPVARVPLVENTAKEALAGPWKQKNSSQCYQTVPSNVAYIEPIEESWSMNHDSAASMFPPTFPPALDLENFQDLSDYCCKPPPDTSSVMAGATKGSSCIVPDDELNTPDIGFQREFNFTSPNVLQEDTSVSLLEPEGWGIPSLDLPQISNEEKFTSLRKEDTTNTNTRTDGIYIDEGWNLTVGHEEEIVSQNQDQRLLIVSQNKDGKYTIVSQNQDHKYIIVSNDENEKFVNESVHRDEMGTNVNSSIVYEVGNELNVKNIDFGNFESVDDAVSQKTCKSDFQNLNLGSLLGVNRNAPTVSNKATTFDSKQQPIMKLSLESLLADSVNEITTNICDMKSREIVNNSVKEQLTISGKNTDFDSTQCMLKTEEVQNNQEEELVFLPEVNIPVDILTKNTRNSESPTNMPGNTNSGDGVKQSQADTVDSARKKVKITLPSLLADVDEISTPVVIDTLLGGNGKFDLMSYVFDNNQTLPLDSPDVKPDFLLSLISSGAAMQSGSSDAISVVGSSPAKTLPIETDVAGSFHTMTLPIKTEVNDNQDVRIVNEIVVDVNENSLDGQWNISKTEEMEVDDDPLQSAEPKGTFYYKPVTGQRKSQKGGKNNRSRSRAVSRKGKGSQHMELESRIQDGPALKLKIMKKMVIKKELPEQDTAPPTRPRGRPAKRQYPSTSKEENLKKSRRRKSSSSSVFEEPPSPESMRSRLSSVESDCDRYRELRDRNNEASRKSRQNRKARELEMKDVATKLEKENQSLRIKAEEMERLVKKLREALIEAVAKPKNT